MEKETDSAAAKLLLMEMRLDSQKHADILDGILKVMNGVPPSKTLWDHRLESYVDQLAVKKALESHIQMEDDVLKQVREQMKETDDEGIKLLLGNIAEDEKKHHKILETIVKNAYKIK